MFLVSIAASPTVTNITGTIIKQIIPKIDRFRTAVSSTL